jgi:hypothetical protein
LDELCSQVIPYRQRGKIERPFAWLKNFRICCPRKRHANSFLSMVQLGCRLILLRRLRNWFWIQLANPRRAAIPSIRPCLPVAKEAHGCSEGRWQQHTPSAGNDFTGVRSISRPIEWLAPHTAKKKSQKIDARAGKLREQQH